PLGLQAAPQRGLKLQWLAQVTDAVHRQHLASRPSLHGPGQGFPCSNCCEYRARNCGHYRKSDCGYHAKNVFQTWVKFLGTTNSLQMLGEDCMARLLKVSPRLPVRDLARTIEFYTSVLNFEASPWPADAPTFVVLERDDTALQFYVSEQSDKCGFGTI